ncbi:MAG TPA: acyl-CoA dehydrogenase family protein [Thermoanaerobaculia bacterium]|nr:acyl-CoA dehydrogenase family protein [Thermoanaerobaculia bacterium]
MAGADHPLDEILRQARSLVEDELVPLEPLLLAERFDELEPALDRVRERVRAAGLWAPYLPEELGGRGLALADFARLSEELGRSPLGHYACHCQAPDVGNLELLMLHGSEAQKERWLRPLARGEIRSCFAMTEPEHAGSNPVHLATTARRDGGDGGDWVIDGHKWFASSADGAAFAVVMATTDPEAPHPYRRASMLLVPTGTPGFRLVRNLPVMGDTGRGWFSHGELRFEGCRVPAENLLGPQGGGFALAQERLGPGRIHHTMRWIGLAERALHEMCSRAAKRELAPGRPLASRQAVQHWIAESRAEIDAARLLVLEAARKIDREGAPAARVEVSAIKFFVAGVLDRVVDRAIQVHGALGVTDWTVLSYIYRHERAARIYDGPDEVHKSVVARRVLKDYGADVEI